MAQVLGFSAGRSHIISTLVLAPLDIGNVMRTSLDARMRGKT
jgi:hypothetical protein